MDESQEKTILVVLVVIAFIFGMTILLKLFFALLNVSLSLSNFVIGLFNLMFNILGIIVGIFGPILVIIVLAWIGLHLFDLLMENVTKTRQLVQESTGNHPERILPFFLAGTVQVLLLLLSNNFTTTSMKFILSIYLWVFVTILLIFTSTEKSKSKTVGKVCLVLISLFLLVFALLKYHLYEYTQLKQTVQQVWQGLSSLPLQDMLSVLLILAFLSTMLFTYYYSRRKD